MILSDVDIKKALGKKKIVIKPKPDLKTQLSSCSLDLRLGDEFVTFQYSKLPFIDIKKPIPTELSKAIKIKDKDFFVLQPGEFSLGITYEWIKLPSDLAARLEGRSSIGRLGIVIHSTASLIDPGFSGKLVLELGNIGRMPVALYKKMKICSISFEKLTSKSEIPYDKKKRAKFKEQKKPAFSRLNFD